MLHNALRARGVESTRYVIMGANHGDLTFLGFDPNVAKPWSSEHVMHGIVASSVNTWADDARPLGCAAGSLPGSCRAGISGDVS
jgi:hypothetical protein